METTSKQKSLYKNKKIIKELVENQTINLIDGVIETVFDSNQKKNKYNTDKNLMKQYLEEMIESIKQQMIKTIDQTNLDEIATEIVELTTKQKN